MLINDLLILMYLYPNKPWYWGKLAIHSDISWDIFRAIYKRRSIDKPDIGQNIEEDRDLLTSLAGFCNKNIVTKLIQIFPDDKMFWNQLSINNNITLDIIESYINKPWNWRRLSGNPNITWEFIKKHVEKPWDWRYISYNPNITWEIIIDNPMIPWCWAQLSWNPNITPEIIEVDLSSATPKTWNWHGLSWNPNVTWEFIKKHQNEDWNWESLSRHSNITYEIVINNPTMPWDLFALSWNPNVTWEFVERCLYKPHDWYWLSRKTTWKIIQTYPDKPWDWGSLSANRNITWKIVKANSAKLWNWDALLQNPNFTWKTIHKIMTSDHIKILNQNWTGDSPFAEDIKSLEGIWQHEIPYKEWPQRQLTWNNGKNYPIIGIHFLDLNNTNDRNPQLILRCLFWLYKQPELPLLPIELVHLIAEWFVVSI
jgi:hypothetical protein